MKRKRMKTRLISLVSLVAILLPLIALTAYGATSSFNFYFNGGTGTWYEQGSKSDLSKWSGTVNVTSGEFGAIGVVNFKFCDLDCIPFTYSTPASSPGSYTITYNTDPRGMAGSIAKLSGTPTNNYVWSCRGAFTP